MRERSFAGSRSGPNRSTQRSCSGAGGEGEKGSEGPGWAFRQPLPNRRFVSAIFRGARATSQRSRGRDAGSRGGNRYPSPDRPRRRDRQVMHVETPARGASRVGQWTGPPPRGTLCPGATLEHRTYARSSSTFRYSPSGCASAVGMIRRVAALRDDAAPRGPRRPPRPRRPRGTPRATRCCEHDAREEPAARREAAERLQVDVLVAAQARRRGRAGGARTAADRARSGRSARAAARRYSKTSASTKRRALAARARSPPTPPRRARAPAASVSTDDDVRRAAERRGDREAAGVGERVQHAPARRERRGRARGSRAGRGRSRSSARARTSTRKRTPALVDRERAPAAPRRRARRARRRGPPRRARRPRCARRCRAARAAPRARRRARGASRAAPAVRNWQTRKSP